jgi:hypothetical protein
MSNPTDLDRVRGAALDRVERAERHFRLALGAAAGLEAAFLVSFLLLANLGDRLHVLLFLSSVGAYSILALGLVVLGTHVNRATQRVLRAIDTLAG